MPHPQQYRTPIKPDKQAVWPVRPRSFGRVDNGFETNSVLDGLGYVYQHQQLPDETVSPLPEIHGGSIDDAVTNVQFLGTNDVDPTTF